MKLIGELPAGTPVAFEAAYGWGWLVELLEDYGFDPHLVHPLRCKAIASARLKDDKVDAANATIPATAIARPCSNSVPSELSISIMAQYHRQMTAPTTADFGPCVGPEWRSRRRG